MAEDVLTLLEKSGCYAYVLLLNPPEELHRKINKVKEKFARDLKTLPAHNLARITLAKFITSQMNEQRIVNSLQHTAMGITPFKVELKDFGSFPTHTIYINVTTKLPVQNLVKKIKQAQSLMKAHKEFKPHFIEEPNINISGKLKPWQYEKAWLQYSNLNFTGRFIADNMLLIRRSLAVGKYEVIKRFAFQDLPVLTKQGDLF